MRYLFIFVLATLQLFSNPKDPYTLAVTEGEPSSLVEGIVSAITGDLYLSKADATIQGSIPLRMPRHYISGDGLGKLAGWVFVDYLEARYEAKSTVSNHLITVKDPNGTVFTYQGSGRQVADHYDKTLSKKKKQIPPTVFSPLDPAQTPGLTNAGQGRLSATTNLRNAHIKFDANGIYFHLVCPDGTQRIYKITEEPENFRQLMNGYHTGTTDYLLQLEKIPSGNLIHYTYDSKNRIHKIRTTDPAGTKTYTWARFEYLNDEEKRDFDLFTSDGKKVEYRFRSRNLGDHQKSCSLLKSINSTEYAPESYQYHEDHDYCGFLVSKRAAVANRFYDIDYYRPKENHVGKDVVQLQKQGDARCLRVKTLSAPVGPSAASLITHRFFYYPEKRFTDVRETDNTLTRYQYTPEMRLEYLWRFGKVDVLTNYERFVWGSDGSLLCRSFFDSSHKPLFSRRFIYDNRGNVLEERFYGDLSGESKTPLVIGTDGFPVENGAEVYTIKRQYSQDGRNLLLKEEEPSGKVTLYNYHPQNSLLISQFICERDQIKIRHFYEYNQDLVVVREVTDDGSTPDPQNLTGLKTGHIQMTTPATQEPYVNMPKTIEEKYFDGSKEVPLKKVVLTYGSGCLVTQKDIYDARGEFCYSLTTKYNQQSHPIEETDAERQTTKHDYDTFGNQTFSQESSGKCSNVMAYDCSNRLTQLEEVSFDGTKRITQYRYDTKHNKIATIDTFGNETRYVYDPFGHVIETHLPPILHADGKTIYPVHYATYDDAGREISRTDANQNTTQTQYNSRNQITRLLHPDGTCENFFYNLDGTLKTHIDQQGTITSFTYDFLGRQTSKTISSGKELLLQETCTYDAFNLISQTNAKGHTTRYEYDGAGRKIAEEFNGEKAEYFYDPLGRLSSTKKGKLLSITKYDRLGRTIEERQEETSGNLLATIAYGYDTAGNRSSVTRLISGKQATEVFLYDAFHRLIWQTDALGHISTTSYIEHHSTPLGKVLRTIQTDPLGLQTIQTYDTLGRLAKTEKKNPFGESLFLEQFHYDPNGNPTCQITTIFNPDHTHHDVTISWEYGTMDRLLSLTEALGTSDQKITRYSYTDKGFLHRTIKPDGTTLENTFDPLGCLIELTSSDGSVHYTYLYNKLGQQLESHDQILHTTTKRQYDPCGRLLSEKLASGYTLSGKYNDSGQRIHLQLPDNSTIEYSYDALFLRTVQWKDLLHTYTSYDQNGALLQEQLPSNLGSISYVLNPLGRKSSAASPFHTHQILEYDPAGNILQMEQDNRKYHFSYDSLYQLSQENDTHHYAHDSLGNRLLKNSEPCQVNDLNQNITHLQYDPNGNPTSKADTKYSYDALNRLIKVETPSALLLFTYDSYHRRLSKTLFTRVEEQWKKESEQFFLYDDQKEIGSVDSSGNILDLRILGNTPHAERGAAAFLILQNKPYIPLYDLFGNIQTLITPDGATIETYQYTAFGEETIFDPSGNPLSHSINPWRYCSKRTDDETGLLFFGRRYYDPSLGRWLTPDPAGFTDGANLYAFVRNNPYSFLDLFGLNIEDYCGGISREINRLRGEQDMICFRTLNSEPSSITPISDSYRPHSSSRDDDSIYYRDLNSSGDPHPHCFRSLSLTDVQTPCGYHLNYSNGLFEPDSRANLVDSILRTLYEVAGCAFGTEITLSTDRHMFLTRPTTGMPAPPLLGRISSIGAGRIISAIGKFIKREPKVLTNVVDINKLAKTGEVIDRGSLTKAGRALQKHGGRPESVFPKPTGPPGQVNEEGQLILKQILSDPKKEFIKTADGGLKIYSSNGRGASFKNDGTFKGFVERQYE